MIGRAKPVLFAAAWALWAHTASAQDACRQALALGLDVSGSVDSREYRLQMDGLAAALLNPDVQQAVLAMPGSPIKIAVYEWSGPGDQTMIQNWTPLRSANDLSNLAARLRATRRAPSEQSTGLGAAMRYGAALLGQHPDCWKRTLDISGDGKSNTGRAPKDVPTSELSDITINALVIGADPLDHGDSRQAEISELSSYFNAYVIHGPDAFVEVALGFDDYERAMTRKLLRELQGFALSALPPEKAGAIQRQ